VAVAVAALATAVLVGCDAGTSPPSATTTSAVPAPAVLTPSAPEVEVVPERGGAPEVLELRVVSIVNPAGQGVSVGVVLETVAGDDGGQSEYDLGRVSVFPPDRPSNFALRVPEAAVRDLTEGGRQATAVLHLDPASAGRPLDEPLRLVVAARLRPA